MTKSVIHRVVCGVCLESKPAHYEPTCCFSCGARFERGAPIALVTIEIGARSSGGQVFIERPAHRVVFRGAWTGEFRDLAMIRIAVGEDDDGPDARNAREV